MEKRLAAVREELAETSEEFRELLDQMHPNWRRRKVLLASDGDVHKAHRKLVQGMFSARRAEALAPYVRGEAYRAADELPVGEPVELIEAYLNAVPMRVIANQLGIGEDHLQDFRRWASDNNSTIGRDDFPPQVVVDSTRSNVEFARYFRGLMDERRENPQDDFTTRLVQQPDDGVFDDEVRLNIMSQLIGAGNDTSNKVMGKAVVRLADDPRLMERLRAEPELVPVFMEEVIRLATPAQGLFRTASEDTVLGGVQIPAGSAVLVAYASANRTEGQFPSPDAIVLDRDNAQNHLAFGKGTHFCVGAPLARVLVRESMQVLLERFGGWTIDEEAGGRQLNQSYLLHGFTELWVRLEPAVSHDD
jgi:cytochrome P450